MGYTIMLYPVKMAGYGRRRPKGITTKSTRRRTTTRRKGPRPALTVRRKVPLATKREVSRNRASIARVKMMMYGSLQKNLVRADRMNMVFDSDRPILFSMDDFTRKNTDGISNDLGGRVYQKGLVSGSIDAIASFQRTTPVVSSPYHEDWNDDTCSSGKYKLRSNRMTLVFDSAAGIQDCYIKVQFIRQKFNRFTIAHDDQVFPDGILHLTDLARPEVGNNLPVKYFQVLQTRRCYINSEKTGVTKGTTGNIKRVNMSYAPKGGKLIKQLTTYPPVQGVRPDPALPEVEGGWFGPSNRGGGSIIWCLISTNHVQTDPQAPTGPRVSITQLRSWFDSVGGY